METGEIEEKLVRKLYSSKNLIYVALWSNLYKVLSLEQWQ